MAEPKWVSIRNKLLTKGMIVRRTVAEKTGKKEVTVKYAYGRVDFGNGLDPTHTGRGIFVDNVSDNVTDTLAGKGTSEKWARQMQIDVWEE
jgi:hypothetical protein